MINQKIEYFVTLAECLSFSRTAMKYDVSQTAISQYIASLERRMGIRLFERSQHSVALTEAGRHYYAFVCDCLRRNEREMELLHALSENYHGVLKIGIGMYEYCSTEDFFSRFLTGYPHIKMDILQYPYSVLTEKLRTRDLDLIVSDALCEEAFASCELRTLTLFESPNYLVADPAVAAKYRSAAEMLKHECLITNCESNGPSSISMLRKLLTEQFGFSPETISQTNSINVQLMMVRAGHGVALVPGFVVERYGQGLESMALPENRNVAYKLMSMKQSDNPAVDLMFSFAGK